ncbi:DUF1801 domain-containing protein [Chitinophagaceae bacterium LWZ2-11]
MPTKPKSTKPTDTEQVTAFMSQLEHPLKAEMEAVRAIIKKSNTKVAERIKWNAPSYYYLVDMVTFNPKNVKIVQLVFHNEAIVKIKSPLLEGDYKDRRLMSFASMADVKNNKKELERIMNEYVALIENVTK